MSLNPATLIGVLRAALSGQRSGVWVRSSPPSGAGSALSACSGRLGPGCLGQLLESRPVHVCGPRTTLPLLSPREIDPVCCWRTHGTPRWYVRRAPRVRRLLRHRCPHGGRAVVMPSSKPGSSSFPRGHGARDAGHCLGDESAGRGHQAKWMVTDRPYIDVRSGRVPVACADGQLITGSGARDRSRVVVPRKANRASMSSSGLSW